MPLPLLIGLVAVGLALIAAAVYRSFGAGTIHLDSDRAAQAWGREFPETEIARVLVSDDGAAALIVNKDDYPGLVRVMGADPAAQRVTKPPTTFDTGRGLRLRLSDFTAPHLHVKLADPADRHIWREILERSGAGS